MSEVIKIKNVIEKHGKELLKYPNVVGYSNDPQPRIRKGKVVPEERVIRVYVSKKLPKEQLKPSDIIPQEIDGVKTDVVEIGEIKKLVGYRGRYRPAPAGVSTSRADEKAAGTIGWFMVDEDGNIYLLSNNHVWAKENNASVGDPIVQPGIYDGGDPEKDVIGRLYSWVDIMFNLLTPNTVDVAIATPTDLQIIYTSIMELGGITGKALPQQNMKAKKVGRTTGYTEGLITDVNATLKVGYSSGVALFQDVFIVEGQGVVGAGDSGSPILDENNKFLGLVFAGNDEGSVLVGCKYNNIETELQRKLGKKIWVLLANAYPPFVYSYKWCIPLPFKLWLCRST